MCGIAGVVTSGPPVDPALLEAMGNSLRHRGPDGTGTWISEDCRTGFVHRRLAIIDLTSAADQPMSTPDGRFIISYNGEIYNYRELRKHLDKSGVAFSTRSDTEVLLRHLERYGEKGLDDLDGMFAFALWDNADKTLFCARDRFGEKPFFYNESGDGRFVFASEIKALFAYGIEPDIQAGHLHRFLRLRVDVFNRDSPDETFYRNVRKLKSAGCLRVREGRIVAQRRYWQLDPEQPTTEMPLEEATAHFRGLFLTSVERRLHADVHVGSSLSGGLDSSSIVCAIDHLKTHSKGRQHTFSARFKDFERDEGQFIDAVVNHVGATAHFTWPNADEFVDELATVFHHQDEPFGSPSIYAQYCVMRLARQNGVTVLLDGQGADETLTGYDHYLHAFLGELSSRDPQLHESEAAMLTARTGFAESPRLAERQAPRIGELFRRSLHPVYRRSGAYRFRSHNNFLSTEFEYQAREEVSASGNQLPPSLNRSLHDDLVDGKLEILLRYADRNSMAHSREVRLPFLSHELVEFAFSLPPTLKIREGWSKYVLRQSMKDLLPEKVFLRTDKVGFDTPERAWLSSARFQQVKAAGRDRLIRDGVVNRRWPDDGSKDWELAMAALLPRTGT